MKLNSSQKAAEMRRAMEMFVGSLSGTMEESQMMEVASVFPEFKIGVAYKIKDVFKYGENDVGDAQLYQVLQDHTSQSQWTPDTATSLYKAIGITPSGIPEWVQPLGATDAYAKGDIVMHKDKKWKSTAENNVWEPGVYGWEEVTE